MAHIQTMGWLDCQSGYLPDRRGQPVIVAGCGKIVARMDSRTGGWYLTTELGQDLHYVPSDDMYTLPPDGWPLDDETVEAKYMWRWV
ncbi:hypothetical protein IIF46_004359 [Salmonella enterica]|nr:hypothetical protein [Salmonella enterica]